MSKCSDVESSDVETAVAIYTAEKEEIECVVLPPPHDCYLIWMCLNKIRYSITSQILFMG